MSVRSWPPRTRAVALGLVIAVAAGLVAGIYWLVGPDDHCASGVEKRGDECVGVTDGSHDFGEDYLTSIFERIATENEWVADSEQPYVTIAFVLPFTDGDPTQQAHALAQVQGAHLAQYRANHRENDATPLIRLVLANPGERSTHWKPMVEQLNELFHSEEANLRAVTGFDVSTPRNEAALRRLTAEYGIPVVAGPVTSSDIGNSAADPDAFPGLAKVNADTDDQARALTSYFGGIDPERTLLIADQREDDNYVASLREVFRQQTQGAPRTEEPFISPEDYDEEGNLANVFDRMVNNICDAEDIDTLYFAGRPVQLRLFINALGRRGCHDQEYRVITGSAGSTVATDEKMDVEALRSGVEVIYTAHGHPDAWTGPHAPDTGGSQQQYEDFMELVELAGLADEVNLQDGRTMLMHDAVWTAVTGIRSATVDDVTIPEAADIVQIWPTIRGEDNRVEGATGWICLDNHGRAYNKALAVVQLRPGQDGGTAIEFQGLAWPDGHPPPPDCAVANET